MEWSWPESVSSNRQRVMEELIQGRELASQLFRVLDDQKSSILVKREDDVGSAEGLVSKILGSFANTLLILKGKESESDQIQASSGGDSGGFSSWDGHHHDDHGAIIKSEDSQESWKSTPTSKDRRGSYKRRKTSHYSWTRDTPALTDDGHAWRKYGQKVILNAKNPRNYFRCTHKFDQSCQATKHTQKIQENPPLFRTTYFGNHTCKDYLRASELVLGCTSPRDGSKFISFSSNNNINLTSDKQDEHPFFSSFTSSVKQEEFIKEEMQQSDHHRRTTLHNHFSDYDDYGVSSDPATFKSSAAPLSGFSSSLDQYDHEDDVISRLLVGSYEFDDEGLQYGF